MLPTCFFLPDIRFCWRVAPAYPLHSAHAFHGLRPSKTDAPVDLFQPHAQTSPATALPGRTTRENKIGLAAVPTNEALFSGVNCE